MSLVDIGLDLQILICSFLHPSDILILRKTCKTLQLITRQRTIWVDALRRVCLENMLFLPTYPILDMSIVELEQAAMAPRRWIELSTSYAARGVSDSEVRISPKTTRIISHSYPRKNITCLILVPGGRYMVGFSPGGFGVWDLGYTSSADCKLIASSSVGPEYGCSVATGNVHSTPDGMGLVIFTYHHYHHNEHYFFHEIHPQSDTPQLTNLACLVLAPQHNLLSCISPDKMIWFDIHRQKITFRVWDYRLNASVSFLAVVDVEDTTGHNTRVVATQTSIIVFNQQEIFIWAIPPLSPQPPNFDDYSLTQFSPVFRIKFPDSLLLDPSYGIWRTISSWYFDPSKPLYFDKVYPWHSQLQRFKLVIKPDFSDATLHFINTIRLTAPDHQLATPFQPMFCEDTLGYTWNSSDQFGIYTGSTLSRPTLDGEPSMTKISLAVDRPYIPSICPVSGRLVDIDHTPRANKIVVFDFLPHRRL